MIINMQITKDAYLMCAWILAWWHMTDNISPN